jgi:HEAT repeat protein
MDERRISELVEALATEDALSAEATWLQLSPLGDLVAPFLREQYHRSRRWQGRVTLLFHATRFGRTSEAAFRLGLEALQDRSFMVRYRACGLLAYALRPEALPQLRDLLQHADPRTVEDASAAIDAIEGRNHHLFIDRDHSGRSHWIVNPEEKQW